MKKWDVRRKSGPNKTIEADYFVVENGALVFYGGNFPVAAFGADIWFFVTEKPS